MRYTTLSIAIAAGIALSLPAQAAKPVWPDALVQLHGAGNAYLIDTKTDAVVATLETCKGGKLRHSFVDVATDTVAKTIAVPSAPHYPVPSPDGKELWLVHEGNDSAKPGIIVYDMTKPDFPVIATLDMPLMGEEVVEAHHGNFTQDGKLFLALNRGPGKDSRGREVAFFDAASKQLVHRLTTASNGVGHTYNTPDGKLAVVTNYGNNVITVIDVEKQKTVKDLRIGAGRMGHIAFTADGKSGYVSNDKDGNVYKLDMTKLSVEKKIETAGDKPGGGQVLNVWTNVFEELPR